MYLHTLSVILKCLHLTACSNHFIKIFYSFLCKSVDKFNSFCYVSLKRFIVLMNTKTKLYKIFNKLFLNNLYKTFNICRYLEKMRKICVRLFYFSNLFYLYCNACLLFYVFVRVYISINITHQQLVTRCTSPVSYTHLDVYKRQT